MTATGVGLSMLQLSPAMTLFAIALMSACATIVVLVAQGPADRAAVSSGRGSGRDPVRSPGRAAALGLWIGSAVVAGTTLVAASPPVALLLLVLAVVTAPSVLRRCAARSVLRLTRPAGPSTAPPSASHPSSFHPSAMHPSAASGALVGASTEQPPLGIPRCDEVARLLTGLSDGELCRLWRATFWELKAEHTAGECLTLVTLRQSCLDEIDRRNPSGLRAWLESGARASGGPERFLNPPHDPGSAHAA